MQNKKLCSISPVTENSKNSNPAIFPEASTLEDIEDPYWCEDDRQDEIEQENTLPTLSRTFVAPSEIFDTMSPSMPKS